MREGSSEPHDKLDPAPVARHLRAAKPPGPR